MAATYWLLSNRFFQSSIILIVIETLEEESDILIKWFTENHMQANPDKFQAISIGRKTHEENLLLSPQKCQTKGQ
jgi:hypothetical protein